MEIIHIRGNVVFWTASWQLKIAPSYASKIRATQKAFGMLKWTANLMTACWISLSVRTKGEWYIRGGLKAAHRRSNFPVFYFFKSTRGMSILELLIAARSNSSAMFFFSNIFIFFHYYIALFFAVLNFECLFVRTSIAYNSSWTLISNIHTFWKWTLII